MCGQLGYSSNDPFDVDKIKTLILWNSLERGIDATGLYSPLNGLKKRAIRGSEFITSSDPELEIIPDTVLMAHCRAKTVGVNCLANTHPFKRGNWLLQHNGTLKNYYDIRQKYKIPYLNFDVDSDILCEAINIEGDLTPLKEIDGPAAVIINNPDVDPLELIIFRNDERPLFKGYVGNSMYISSIKESLVLIKCINIKEFKKDRIYHVKNGVITKSYDIKNTPYKHVYVNTNPYANSNNNSNTTPVNHAINYYLTNKYFLNSWVRYNSTFNLSYGGLKFQYDNYYLVKQVLGNGMLEVYDPVTKLTGTVWYSNFEASDIIRPQTYCRALYNIYKDTNEKEYSVVKGQIVYCTLVDKDQDSIRVNDAKSKINYLTYTNKEYFVRLTDEELKEFMNNSKNESPFIDTLPENQQNLDVQDEVETESEDVEEDSLSELCNNLETTGNTLEEINMMLNYEMIDPKVRLLVVEAIETNDKAKSHALLLYNEDDNELEEVELNHE
jgi:hypothetical protein